MLIIPSSSFVQCYFEADVSKSASLPLSDLEVYYGITKNLFSKQMDLGNFLTNDERSRAEKFLFDEDRNTYLICHGLLRMILSWKLNKNPLEVTFTIDENSKPGLDGNPLYFNITHVRDAFAIAISKHYYVGIDMENWDQDIDFLPIIKEYFSIRECKFILETKTDSQDRFFLLWTRKEALLKAIGTGIVTDLAQIEVVNRKNKISIRLFDSVACQSLYNEHYIYSLKVTDYFISVAIPRRVKVVLNQINETNIAAYLK
jgi:4'-phosphopantetheinyl transferase